MLWLRAPYTVWANVKKGHQCFNYTWCSKAGCIDPGWHSSLNAQLQYETSCTLYVLYWCCLSCWWCLSLNAIETEGFIFLHQDKFIEKFKSTGIWGLTCWTSFISERLEKSKHCMIFSCFPRSTAAEILQINIRSWWNMSQFFNKQPLSSAAGPRETQTHFFFFTRASFITKFKHCFFCMLYPIWQKNCAAVHCDVLCLCAVGTMTPKFDNWLMNSSLFGRIFQIHIILLTMITFTLCLFYWFHCLTDCLAVDSQVWDVQSFTAPQTHYRGLGWNYTFNSCFNFTFFLSFLGSFTFCYYEMTSTVCFIISPVANFNFVFFSFCSGVI